MLRDGLLRSLTTEKQRHSMAEHRAASRRNERQDAKSPRTSRKKERGEERRNNKTNPTQGPTSYLLSSYLGVLASWRSSPLQSPAHDVSNVSECHTSAVSPFETAQT